MKGRKALFSGIALAALCAMLFSEGTKRDAWAMAMSSITSESIREKEEQIRRAQNEKEELKSGLSDLKTIKGELEAQRSSLKDYVVKLDGNLAQIEQNIAELGEKISVKESEIAAARKELESAQKNEEDQKESMVRRIRLVYESGDPQMLDMLLKSSSFSDFLNKADYVERVLDYDWRMLQDYTLIREYVELCRQNLELEKEILDETKAGVEEEQRNLEDLIEQKSRDIIEYETDIKNKEKVIREYEEEIKAQEEEIATLESLIAEEKKKIIASSGVVLTYDGGAFTFPLASYTRVSDEYGPRIDPILGIEKFHSGVDLASPKGTSIYAAYDGIVVAATYSASMGNYVMIDHGSGLYTIYMHASALYVEKDDVVIRGETIAAVGSTGRSTGNHLHFSVRLNGEYQSPWNYIRK